MTEYEKLLDEANSYGLIVKEKPLKANNGRICGNRLAIRKDMTETEKKCTMAEELGHYHTTVGDILDQSSANNRKQELRAHDWAVRSLISLDDLIQAVKDGCRSTYDVADYLDITEDLLQDAINYYRRKYGVATHYNGYIVIFNDYNYVVYPEE